MTDIASLENTASGRREPALRTPAVAHVLYPTVALAAGAGLLLGRPASTDVSGFEDKLVLLLRFMAVMKALMVAGAVALTHWRLRAPVSERIALGYVAALGLMAAAPGLIWSLGHIAAGAALFHAGLFAFLVIAWREDAISHVLAGRGAKQP